MTLNLCATKRGKFRRLGCSPIFETKIGGKEEKNVIIVQSKINRSIAELIYGLKK